jgi:hypothetical protein
MYTVHTRQMVYNAEYEGESLVQCKMKMDPGESERTTN